MPFESKSWLVWVLLTIAVPMGCSARSGAIDYPEGYRHWTHIKTGVVDKTHPLFEDFGGFHHVYANRAAFEALRSQSTYPDGAAFVFDLLVAKPFPGGIGHGERRRLDVMQKDAKTFASTGGWGFGSFEEGTRDPVEQNVVDKCYACHEPQKPKDYVFSEFRE
jgi:hypothetical protein